MSATLLRFLAIAVAFVSAHVAAALAGGAWWGLHHFRYLDPSRIALIATCASLVAAAFAIPRERLPSLPPTLRGLLLVAACFAAFWGLRDRTHLLGDGSVILEGSTDAPTWSEKEPLAHVADFTLHRLARRLDVPIARVFELCSCLFGAALVALLARAERKTGGGGRLLLLVLTTGAVQLFCGYVEHYPPLAFVTVAFLLTLRRPVETSTTLLPALFLFVIALFLHLSSIVLLPALAWTILRQTRVRSGPSRAVPAIEVAAAVCVALIAWSFLFRGVTGASSLAGYLSTLTRASQFAVAPGGDAASVGPSLASMAHLRDFANLQLLLVPVALPLAAAGIARVGRTLAARPWDVALALTAICFLAAQLLFSPYLGAPRDWDVLAAGAFPIAMLAASLTDRISSRASTSLVAGLATLHVLAWVVVNATPSAALARFEELPLPVGQVDFVLGTRALKEGDVGEATARFQNVVRDMPNSCPGWFSLGLVHEARGDFSVARDAFAHALVAWEGDRRVPKGEILERWGRAAWQLGQEEEARRAFEVAHEERPRSLPPRVFLAVVGSREGRPADVLGLLEPVLDRKAEQPAILMLTADALDALGRPEEARARRLEAARLFPNDPAVKAALERRPVKERP